MKLNSTVVLTFILLFLMLAAGVLSGLWGFAVGKAALKGVTQPEVRPTNKLAGNKQTTIGKDDVETLREKDILAKVKSQMNTTVQPKPDESKNKDKPKTKSNPTTDKKAKSESASASKTANSQIEFLRGRSSPSVTIEVHSA